MDNFISNTGASDLRSRLRTLISAATELRFLVGFFYFSGIRVLYDALKNRPGVILRVLIGLSADRGIHGLYEFADSGRNRSDQEIAENFLYGRLCQEKSPKSYGYPGADDMLAEAGKPTRLFRAAVDR